MMKKINILISCTLILSMLISCTSVNRETLNVLDQMCGTFCWNGIVVGSTTREELLRIISDPARFDQNSISEMNQLDGLIEERIFFSFYGNPGKNSNIIKVSAYLMDQKAVALDLNENLGVNFQDVINEFGEPDLVFAIKNQASKVDIGFINSSKGISFSYTAPSEKSSITPDTDILTIEFYDVGLYHELLESGWLIPGYSELRLYPWNGYGNIEEHYWPPR